MSMADGYGLSLSDGSNWWITADRDNLSLLDKLARVMKLRNSESNGSAKLIFSEILSKSDDKEDIGRYNTILEYIASSVSKRDWACYDSRTVRIWNHKQKPISLCEAKYRDYGTYVYLSLSSSMTPIFLQSISQGGITFHASSAELDGKAVLFVAPSGTGKSTCYRRLPDYWKRLGDDENLVVLSKDGSYRVHPFPTWSEYILNKAQNTWDVQYSTPVSAVFLLQQADIDEALPVGSGEAAFVMNRSARETLRLFWLDADKESQVDCRRKLFANVCEMATKVPTFRLRATLDGKFWEEVEKVIK